MKVRSIEIVDAYQYRHFHPPVCVVETREVFYKEGESDPTVTIKHAKVVGTGAFVMDGDWIIGWPDGQICIYRDAPFREKFEVVE